MDLGSFQFQFTVQMVNVDHWLSMLYFVDKDVDAFHATTYLPIFCYSLMTIIHPEFPLLRILYHKSNHSCLLPKKKKINKMKIFWVWLGLENQICVLLTKMFCTLPTYLKVTWRRLGGIQMCYVGLAFARFLSIYVSFFFTSCQLSIWILL